MLLLGDLSSSSPVAMPWLVLSWMCGFAACRNFAGRGGIYARSHGAARLSGNHGGPRCCCRLPLVLRSQLVVLQAATALSVPPHLTKLRRPRSSRQPSFLVSRRCSSSVRPCASRRMPRTGLVRYLLSAAVLAQAEFLGLFAPVLGCFPGGLSILRRPLPGTPFDG